VLKIGVKIDNREVKKLLNDHYGKERRGASHGERTDEGFEKF
jgi:hypothetical protein